MKTDKQTFVFRLEWAQVLKQQPDSIRLAVYDAIIDYVQTGHEPPQQSAVYFAFLFIKNQIDKDTAKYDEVCAKRAEAGKKHKGNQHTINRNKLKQTEQMEQVFQNGTNGTNNDNEYDNDNDIIINDNSNTPQPPLKGGGNRKPKRQTEVIDYAQAVAELEPEIKDSIMQCATEIETWIEYKKAEFRKTYKSATTFKAFLKLLYKLGNGNPETMKAIVEQSIANRYQGIFELKKSYNNGNNGTSNRSIQERAERIAEYAFAANGLQNG